MVAPHQKGLSLVELMITLALGSVLVLGISRYSIDALQSQETVTQQADIQDSARIAMEKIRTEIQRGGYLGCNDVNRFTNVPLNGAWKDRIDFLIKGVEVNGNRLKTAHLTPLLPQMPQNVPLTISVDRKTISIPASAGVAFPHRDNTLKTFRLFIGNCRVLDIITPPTINAGDLTFTLKDAASDKIVNLETNTLLDGVQLYEYSERNFRFSAAANGAGLGYFETNPNQMIPYVTGLENNGVTISETAPDSRVFDVSLNFLDDLRNDVQGPPPAGEVEPGLYTSRVIARNAGGE